MTLKNIFPWQVNQWQQIWRNHQQNRLPHALLLTGLPGLGKKIFALTLAHALLCNKPDDDGNPCFTCHSCHLINAESHPDFRLVEPEENMHPIKIDQIREIVSFANTTAMQNGYRVVIIHPASAMNVNAANAILKILEEPSAKTVFILINEQCLRLPATVTSRCQKIIFNRPSNNTALNWLKEQRKDTSDNLPLLLNLANGAPLKAIELIENKIFSLRQEFYQAFHLLSQGQKNPLQQAADFFEHNPFIILNFLLSWSQDLLRLKLTNGKTALINFDYENIFLKLYPIISKADLLCYISLIQQAYSRILASFNLNRQLLFEELFIRWAEYVSR